MVNTLSHICGQDSHTLGINYLALSKYRFKLQPETQREQKSTSNHVKE